MRLPGANHRDQAGEQMEHIVNRIDEEQAQQAAFFVREAGPMRNNEDEK